MADALLATNGIVSIRQAGKLRYMDYTEAEQERGITMKSSVVGLVFTPGSSNIDIKDSKAPTFLINLVDSPGHIDFAPEVSTAVRICDAAVVVVDVVEGVCPQTRAVLRQAWNERLTLVLVLNKIDRLVLELKLTPLQAYEVMCRVIEQVNSVLAEMFSADLVRQRDENWQISSETDQSGQLTYNWDSELVKADDSNLYFSPDRGNVLFASAIDTWGFRPSDFLPTWSKRLNVPCDKLRKVMWSDFYLSKTTEGGKTRPVLKPNAREKQRKPVFVQLILEPIWKAYETLVLGGNRDQVSAMATKLGVQLDPRSIRNTDCRGVLRALLTAWLPLGANLLLTITEVCPSPLNAVSADRAVHMLYGDQAISGQVGSGRADAETTTVQVNQTSRLTLDSAYANSGVSLAIQASSSAADAPTIVFVAKVFWIDKVHFAGTRYPKPSTGERTRESAVAVATGMNASTQRDGLESSDGAENSKSQLRPVNNSPPFRSPMVSTNPFSDVEFIALARVFSGSVYPGQKLFVLGPKFDGSKIPSYLLNADPTDFPVGPLRLRSNEDTDDLDRSTNCAEDALGGTSPAPSSCAAMSRSGSFGGSSSGIHTGPIYLRHVYVAIVVSVLQFLGGQHDLVEIEHPVPSGNIVGLTGPDLITFLPKSGLLVSRLSLVAGTESSDGDHPQTAVLPLAGLAVWHGAPVMSVAVEPASANPEDVYRLERGLRFLDRADPCAEVTVAPTGEYLIKAAGEVHLKKCLEDMEKYFAPEVELHISHFVVPFRETIISSCSTPAKTLASVASESYNKACQRLELLLQKLELRGAPEAVLSLKANEEKTASEADTKVSVPVALKEVTTTEPTPSSEHSTHALVQQENTPALALPNKPWRLDHLGKGTARGTFKLDRDLPECPLGYFQLPHSKSRTRVLIRVTAHPLPAKLVQWAEQRGAKKVPQLIRAFKTKSENYPRLCAQFKQEFADVCTAVAKEEKEKTESVTEFDWTTMSSSFLTLGPHQTGPNMLFTRLKSKCFPLFTAWGEQVNSGNEFPQESKRHGRKIALPLISYAKALLRGFQMATERGPLCAEPMRAVMFVVEEICAEELHLLDVPQISATDSNALDSAGPTEVADPPLRKSPDETQFLAPPPCENNIKDEAITKRKKSKRLTSVSWLDDSEFGGEDNDDEEDEEDQFSTDSYDDEDWHSEESDEKLSENNADEEETETNMSLNAETKSDTEEDLLAELQNIPYWSRRTDNVWLQDVPPGLLTSAMNRACLAAFQACAGQRLMLAMYTVELQTRRDVLGRMFAVLRRRHGRVVSEDFRDGENTFVICARLPVIESFGLADELRSRTSGLMSLPQLRAGGWELLDIDPVQRDASSEVNKVAKGFTASDQHKSGLTSGRSRKKQLSHVSGTARSERDTARPANPLPGASTADSDEENVDEPNAQLSRVRRYIRDIRLRKGLPTNEQLVLYADKQRTLKKNK
ncbi:unnamed protein product [Calicophoron daubneyi]|uniref:Tr-type G domain-containing protein n=1 Tax=Calicophoron daubneyi TaxID=300641 RepID=A0AAV2TBE6_CALDB